jgi:hypothetical protein
MKEPFLEMQDCPDPHPDLSLCPIKPRTRNCPPLSFGCLASGFHSVQMKAPSLEEKIRPERFCFYQELKEIQVSQDWSKTWLGE